MDESSSIKAIMIGVGVFISIATITAVMSYYNSSKDLVRAAGSGVDFNEQYSNYIEGVLLKTDGNSYITGNDVKNLLNYFYKSDRTEINISNMTPLYSDSDETLLDINLSGRNVNNDETKYIELSSKIVPNQKFRIVKSNNSGKLIIDLTGIK